MNPAASRLSLVESMAFEKYKAEKRLSKETELTPLIRIDYEAWCEKKGTPEAKPSHRDPRFKGPIDQLTRLAPDFERRRRMFNLRLGTLLKIYMSKWFYRGLQFHEWELVRYLLDRLQVELDFLNDKLLTNTIGIFAFANELNRLEKGSFNAMAWGTCELHQVMEFVYSEKDFLSIWNLGSFQGLRDFIFQFYPKEEHEGKLGIKKPRIRGYRDGKASPKDPTLIKHALQLDVMFWEAKYQEKLKSYFDTIDAMASTFILESQSQVR